MLYIHLYTRGAHTHTQRGLKMISSILSADLAYAEIAFFAILVIGFILGLIRGFSKSFHGILLTIAVILISILLISPTFMPVRNISVFNSIETSITQKIEESSEIFSMPIEIAENGKGERVYWTTIQVDGEAKSVALEQAMGSDMASSVKGKLATWLAEKFITQNGQTIGYVAGVFVTDIIVMVIMFMVYNFVLHLICSLFRRLFAKMHNSSSDFVRGIDRTAGAIVSTAFALIFILLALAILYMLRSKLPQVDEVLSSSKVCGYLYANNPIATLFSEIFG